MSKSKIEKMKKELPYGKYVFEDGSQILFNRRYETILPTDMKNQELKNDKENRLYKDKITKAKKVWFYNDSNPPWINQETLRKCQEVLKVFGAE